MRALLLPAAVLATLGPALAQTWTNKVTDTPSLVQEDFGAYGQRLPIDGAISCGETAIAMSMLWLARNGYTQLATASTDPAEVEAAGRNLIEIFQGLIDGAPDAPLQQGAYYEYVVSTYLSLRGISPDQVTISFRIAPDAEWIAQAIEDQSVAHVQAGWYFEENGVLERTGQHWWTPLAVDTANATFTINNPSPSAYYDVLDVPANNPQTLPTAPLATTPPTDPALPAGDYLQVDTPEINPATRGRAILEVAWSFRIDDSARPDAGHTPAAFSIEGERYINVGNGTLEALARIEGDGGILKLGNGTFVLLAEDVSLGKNRLGQGTTISRTTSATPLGFGSLELFGNAALRLEPGGDAPVAISQTLASGPDTRVTYAGGNVLALTRGIHASQTLTIGGFTDNATRNLAQAGTGTLVLAPSDGVAALGTTQRVLVAGAAGNQPDNVLGAVLPSLVGQDNDAARSGRFLRYDATAGFVAADVTLASATPIADSTSATIYAVDADQAISSGQTAAAHLLELRGHDVTGGAGSALQLGSRTAGAQAGLILNGGDLAVPTVDFGAADLYVYASDAGGTIGGGLTGTGSVVFFGPGTTTLTAASDYSGGTKVERGTVVAGASSGAALGSGLVTLGDQARLVVQTGASVGEVRAGANARVTLAGGTVGGLRLAEGDYELQGGGIVEGGGTVNGAATIFGTIRAGEGLPGTIRFADRVTMEGGFLNWRLDATDANPTNAGVLWNSLVLEDGTSTLGTEDAPFFFLPTFGALADPESGDPFWTESHRWLLVALPEGIGEWYWSDGGVEFSSGSFGLRELADGIYVEFTPVPEPGSLALVAVGAGAIALGAWRGRRRLSGR